MYVSFCDLDDEKIIVRFAKNLIKKEINKIQKKINDTLENLYEDDVEFGSDEFSAEGNTGLVKYVLEALGYEDYEIVDAEYQIDL